MKPVVSYMKERMPKISGKNKINIASYLIIHISVLILAISKHILCEVFLLLLNHEEQAIVDLLAYLAHI